MLLGVFALFYGRTRGTLKGNAPYAWRITCFRVLVGYYFRQTDRGRRLASIRRATSNDPENAGIPQSSEVRSPVGLSPAPGNLRATIAPLGLRCHEYGRQRPGLAQRDAIDQVNLGLFNEIDFHIDSADSPNGEFLISPSSEFSPIDHPVLINGEVQSLFTGGSPPLVRIDGGSSSSADGLTLAQGSGGSTIQGLCISGFANGAGIHIESAGNLIVGNYLGTDITGEKARNNLTGILIDNASNNTIGAANVLTDYLQIATLNGNLISGNTGNGLDIRGNQASGNVVLGNLIGVERSGSKPLGNAIGVALSEGAARNEIGTLGATGIGIGGFPKLNVISGNSRDGIDIEGTDSSPETTANTIGGNYIGTDYAGTFALFELGRRPRLEWRGFECCEFQPDLR